MDSEWREVHTKDLQTAMNAIWTPKESGPWRDSGDFLRMLPMAGKRVLDFGCGVGRNLRWLV